MIDRFLSQTSFSSQEDFVKNLKIHVPDNFNFGYDIVDAWAAEQPDKPALLWTNDKGEHNIQIRQHPTFKVWASDMVIWSC